MSRLLLSWLRTCTPSPACDVGRYFVLSHYQNDTDKLDLGKNLGMTAEAVGAAVTDYALARKPSGR